MRKIIDLAFRRANKQERYELFADDSKNPSNLTDMINELFGESTEDLIAIRVIADDLTEKEMDFNCNIATDIVNGKKKGEIFSASGEKIKLLAAELDDDYSFIGLHNNRPMQWNDIGAPKNGDPELRLKKIIVKTK